MRTTTKLCQIDRMKYLDSPIEEKAEAAMDDELETLFKHQPGARVVSVVPTQYSRGGYIEAFLIVYEVPS